MLGLLPDGMRLFDRLTGTQLITYAGLLRGMDRDTVAARTADLLRALDLRGRGRHARRGLLRVLGGLAVARGSVTLGFVALAVGLVLGLAVLAAGSA